MLSVPVDICSQAVMAEKQNLRSRLVIDRRPEVGGNLTKGPSGGWLCSVNGCIDGSSRLSLTYPNERDFPVPRLRRKLKIVLYPDIGKTT